MKERYGEFSRWCEECGGEFHRDEMRGGYDGQYYDHMDEVIEPEDDWY